MGTFSSVVRQLLAITHLRYSDWPRIGKLGTSGTRQSKVSKGHDEDAVRGSKQHRCVSGPSNWGRPATVLPLRAGPDCVRHACLCRDLRTGALDALYFFHLVLKSASQPDRRPPRRDKNCFRFAKSRASSVGRDYKPKKTRRDDPCGA